jgi:replicative DNA helicase
MTENTVVANVQNELLFIGVIFKKPDLYMEFERYIKSKYYFSDEMTKFFYDEGFSIYKNRTQNFNETAINLYMSEDKDRFALYKKYGGFKTIEEMMDIALVEDAKTYFDVIQKFALARELERKGFNTEKYRTSRKFNDMNAKHFYFNVKKTIDDIHTRITGDPDVETLNSSVTDMVNLYLDKPAMGQITPFYSFNDLFRGLRTGTAMGAGMTSNSGKTRFMTKLIAFLAFARKEKCLVLLNEMSIEDIRLALLTTCLNNREIQELTGVTLNKDERELALGIYFNKNNEPIYRNRDDITGEFSESTKEYIQRLSEESIDYNKVCAVARWIEEQIDNKIYVVDVSTAYTDEDLDAQIRKGVATKGIRYIFYDTLKNELATLGEWAALKQTTTKLAELAKNLNVFIFCNLQLTDEVNVIDPLDLNSMNIAASKGLKTVLTTLTLWKEIDKKNYHKYSYMPTDADDYGKQIEQDIPQSDDPAIKMYSCCVDKNRAGAKKKLLFQVNLDTNEWYERGLLFKK